MPSMPSSEGLILDATALIDFVGLGVGMATTAVQPSVYFSRSSGFRSVRRVYPLCCYPIPETLALDTEEMFFEFHRVTG